MTRGRKTSTSPPESPSGTSIASRLMKLVGSIGRIGGVDTMGVAMAANMAAEHAAKALGMSRSPDNGREVVRNFAKLFLRLESDESVELVITKKRGRAKNGV